MNRFSRHIFLLTILIAVILILSCSDMYSDMQDNMPENYRLSIAEITSTDARLLHVNNDGIYASSWTYNYNGTCFFQRIVFNDFNKDDNLDIFILRQLSGPYYSAVFYSDGNGNITNTVTVSNTTSGSNDIAVADFDGNKLPDLALAVTGGGTNDCYMLNNGSTGFSLNTIGTIGSNSRAITPGDYDKDGDIDLFLGNQGMNHELFINRINEGGTFQSVSWSATPTSSAISDIQSGDLDGDGDIDLIEVNSPGEIRVRLNNGNAYFTHNWFSTGPYNATKIVLSDFDGDSDIDAFVVINGLPSINRILLNDGNGNFTISTLTAPGTEATNAAATGDMDLDGDIDLVLSETNATRIYLNDGNGNFSIGKTYPSFGTVVDVSLGVILK